MENNYEERKRLGKRIAELRREKGLSEEEFAERIGIRVATIPRIELGKYGYDIDTLAAIAEALDCQIDFVQKI